MTLVTNTGIVWDADHTPIPAINEPELWFRPIATAAAAGLLTDREIPAKTFNVASGAFTVELESAPGLLYTPVMSWLKSPADPRNRARGETEWKPFNPGDGGPIDQLPGVAPFLSGIWFGLGDPPQVLKVRNDIVYFDISGVPNGKPWLWIDPRFVVGGGA